MQVGVAGAVHILSNVSTFLLRVNGRAALLVLQRLPHIIPKSALMIQAAPRFGVMQMARTADGRRHAQQAQAVRKQDDPALHAQIWVVDTSAMIVSAALQCRAAAPARHSSQPRPAFSSRGPARARPVIHCSPLSAAGGTEQGSCEQSPAARPSSSLQNTISHLDALLGVQEKEQLAAAQAAEAAAAAAAAAAAVAAAEPQPSHVSGAGACSAAWLLASLS